MRPASRCRAPVSRLNMVLWPAPFGPISPRISPAARSKLTLSTATRPPKRRSAPSTRSTGVRGLGLSLRSSACAGARMLQKNDEQHRENDDFELSGCALSDHRQVVLDTVLQERDDARTDDGAHELARPA